MIALASWTVFLVLALAGLHATPVPTGTGVEAAFAAVRLVALGLGVYLLTVTLIGSFTRLVRVTAAVQMANTLTLPFVRRILDRAATVALVASMVTPSAALAAERPSEPPPVMRLVEEPAPAPIPPTEAPAAPVTDRYVVRPGNNCWTIAARTLEARLGRPATDTEILPYWQGLLAANAGRFPSGDPGLIFSGDELVLPGI